MVENPYFHRSPVKDSKFFFGRAAETQQVLSCVSRKQSVSVVGPRRIGKTSLLFHLSDPEVKAAHGLGDNSIFVYVDCQGLSGDLSESDVYWRLLAEIVEVTQGSHSAEHNSRGPVTYLDFEKSLDEIIARGLRIVFLFDEFEAIAGNRQIGKGFFNRLRGLGQADEVVYVTASGETLYDLSFDDENVLSSPFFNIFYPVWLGFMKSQEAGALVDNLAVMADFEGFDESDHAFLQGIAGPHPFYLQVACYHLFEEKVNGADSTAPDYDRVKHQFAKEMRGHFQYAWRRLSRDEHKALKLVGKGHLDKVAAEDLERLEQKCLVYQGEIFSSVFADFVIDALESGSVGIEHVLRLPLAWRVSGALLLFLALVLGILLVWQAPTFVQHLAFSIWNAAKALWIALGQIGDVSGGLALIIVVLPIVVAGIKERKRIRQIIDDLLDRLRSVLM